MKRSCCSLARQPKRSSGRTLLELMISISIGLVVLGAIIAVYMASTRTGRQSNAITRMSEDAAIAMNYLGNNLRMAGFSTPRALVSSGSVSTFNGVQTIKADKNFDGAAIRGCDNGFSNLSSATFDSLACSTTVGGAAAFAVRFEADANNTTPITVSGITYPSDCLANAVKTGAPSAYQGPAAGATVPTGALTEGFYRLTESRFFVQTSSSNGTVELFCGGNGAGFGSPQPLMQYVETVAIRYGIAASNNPADRDVTVYGTASDVDALTGDVNARWSRVVSVRLCLLMRSEEKDQNGNGPYTNCAGSISTSADGFLRRTFISTFSLRNRANFATTG